MSKTETGLIVRPPHPVFSGVGRVGFRAGLVASFSILSAVILLVMVLLPAASCGYGAGGDEIVVGEFGSLTGDTADFGKVTHNGIELAIEEINASGGVKGKHLRLKTEDDQSRAEEAATVVAKLINQDKVIALLGEVASSRSLAAAPKAQDAKVPMISPSSTNPAVTLKGDYIFRVCFLDDFQGHCIARFAHDTLGTGRAAILRDIRNDYSVGLANFFAEEFQRRGGAVVSDQSYSAGDADFKAQLTAIRSSNPDVIMIPGYYNDVGQIAIQARDLGITVPLIGGDGWESPNLLAIGGKALEGCYYSNHFDPSSLEPVVANFVKKYSEKYGQAPGALAALGYDATKLLADAINRAPELTGPAIRDQLAGTKGYPGVSGTITMDQNRNPVKPLVVLQIKDGKISLRETIPPS